MFDSLLNRSTTDMAEIRSRHRPHTSLTDPTSPSSHDDEHNTKHSTQIEQWMGSRHWLLFVIFNASLVLYVQHANSIAPTPLTIATAPQDRFVEERARRILDAITGLGSRPVGSLENEVRAVKYLVHEIEALQRAANAAHSIELDVQSVGGSFSMNFIGGLMTVYQNMHNVVVKLSPSR